MVQRTGTGGQSAAGPPAPALGYPVLTVSGSMATSRPCSSGALTMPLQDKVHGEGRCREQEHLGRLHLSDNQAPDEQPATCGSVALTHFCGKKQQQADTDVDRDATAPAMPQAPDRVSKCEPRRRPRSGPQAVAPATHTGPGRRALTLSGHQRSALRRKRRTGRPRQFVRPSPAACGPARLRRRWPARRPRPSRA